MERLVDLDALASRLQPAVAQWQRKARVGPFTWRDAQARWPAPIVAERSSVEVAESLGIKLWREPDNEFELVVWTGGWADVGSLVDGEITTHCPEFHDVDGAYTAVVQSIERFLAA